MGSSTVIPEKIGGVAQERERAELAAILEYEPFRRSPQLSRFLSYLCEKYFDGSAGEIKEYSIAVEVLGRSEDFDPQIDAIVRVDAYHLRKRLKQYYVTEGADHDIQLVLPQGQYTPKFVPRPETVEAVQAVAGLAPAQIQSQRGVPSPDIEAVADTVPGVGVETIPAPPQILPPIGPRSWTAILRGEIGTPSVMAAIILAALTLLWFARGEGKPKTVRERVAAGATTAVGVATSESANALIEDDTDSIRIMAGSRKSNYIDTAGHLWLPDRYFTGGAPFHRALDIQRTQDPELYQNGREGGFSYRIPLKAGIYDLRLYFAETAVKGEGLRGTNVVINGVDAATVDIASDAGGVNTATAKIFKNVSPAPDGVLSLIFQGTRLSPSFLNALEIVPGTSGKMRTIRLTTADHPYKDHAGHFWLPDTSAYGGRRSTRTAPVEGTADPALYHQQRFGHFTYSIPVVEGGKYTVILHFAETWFGTVNSPGGPGSRVFDVYCNGNTLLKEFDILRHSASNRELLKVFHGVAASPQGKINLEFTPRTNYALINALEIIEE